MVNVNQKKFFNCVLILNVIACECIVASKEITVTVHEEIKVSSKD